MVLYSCIYLHTVWYLNNKTIKMTIIDLLFTCILHFTQYILLCGTTTTTTTTNKLNFNCAELSWFVGPPKFLLSIKYVVFELVLNEMFTGSLLINALVFLLIRNIFHIHKLWTFEVACIVLSCLCVVAPLRRRVPWNRRVPCFYGEIESRAELHVVKSYHPGT